MVVRPGDRRHGAKPTSSPQRQGYPQPSPCSLPCCLPVSAATDNSNRRTGSARARGNRLPAGAAGGDGLGRQAGPRGRAAARPAVPPVRPPAAHQPAGPVVHLPLQQLQPLHALTPRGPGLQAKQPLRWKSTDSRKPDALWRFAPAAAAAAVGGDGCCVVQSKSRADACLSVDEAGGLGVCLPSSLAGRWRLLGEPLPTVDYDTPGAPGRDAPLLLHCISLRKEIPRLHRHPNDRAPTFRHGRNFRHSRGCIRTAADFCGGRLGPAGIRRGGLCGAAGTCQPLRMRPGAAVCRPANLIQTPEAHPATQACAHSPADSSPQAPNFRSLTYRAHTMAGPLPRRTKHCSPAVYCLTGSNRRWQRRVINHHLGCESSREWRPAHTGLGVTDLPNTQHRLPPLFCVPRSRGLASSLSRRC